MPGVESCYTLVLSRRSILDTLFLVKSPHGRRVGPAYATTTNGPVTTLWRIDNRGSMSEVSRIIWPSTLSQSHQVLINGQLMLVENVLQRSKSLFGSDSRTFAAGTSRFKWKRGSTGAMYTGSEPQYSITQTVYTESQAWTCYENTDTSTPSDPDSSSSSTQLSAPVVALFFPPQTGLIKSELTIYPNGEVIVDHIVLTALLLCARKDEWRSSRTRITPGDLEASIWAEIHDSLPPYLPVSTPRSRITSPTHRRRPRTATAAITRSASPRTPPPYTSVDDVSLHPQRS